MSPGLTRSKALTGAPRWMVTFADLMALLFALFVLLLSFSEIDSDKFRKNASSIARAFNVTDLADVRQTIPQSNFVQPGEPETPLSESVASYLRSVQRQKLLSELNAVMLSEIEQHMVELESTETTVIVRFPDKSAFSSGSVRLAPAIEPALNKVAEVISRLSGEITVTGHTDDTPISTAQFRSNWELSAGRAAAVVHYLLRDKRIRPGRVAVQGLADTKSLVPNDSPANRSRNRRVEISIEVTASRGR